MPYSPNAWQDYQAGGTPITAAQLRHIETQYQSAIQDSVHSSFGTVFWAGSNALNAFGLPVTDDGSSSIVAIGRGAMSSMTAAKLGIAIGRNAQGNGAKTRDNIAIGDESLRNVSSGSVDYTQADLSGTRNIAIGSNSSYFTTSGYLNISMGRNALSCMVSGQGATAIGGNAIGGYAPVGFSGSIENWGSWGSGTDRVYTTAVGSNAAQSCLAYNNTAIGGDALRLVKKSNFNTAVGAQALGSLDSSTGYSGGNYLIVNLGGTYSWSGTSITFNFTSHGLLVNDIAYLQLTSGSGQTFQGDAAPAIVATSATNSFTVNVPTSLSGSGSAVLVAKETSAQATKNENNTALGSRAGANLLTGSVSTFVGNRAGEATTSSLQSTSLGSHALLAATSMTNSTAFGFYAAGSMSGDASTVTAVGASALRTRVDGNPMTDPFTNVTGLGYNARVSGSNQLQLGDTATTVYAQSAVQTRSDQRDKADIQETKLGLEFINQLRPVDYRWDVREDYTQYDEEGNATGLAERDGSQKRNRFHHGVIAQEVQKVIEDTGVDFGGFQDHTVAGGSDVMSVGYEEFIAPLIKAVQELSKKVAELEAKQA